MFKLCKTEESARRQREIEASLFELMHTKHYDDISITELCLRLNMPRKAFYRYFDSKDDAIRAFLLHTLSEYRGFDMSEKEMKNRSLRRELEMYFSFWQDHRDILITFERSGMLELVTELSVSFPIGERVSTARFLPDDSEHTRDMVFRFAFAGLVRLMLDWYKSGFAASARQMSTLAVRLMTEPLFGGLEKIGIKD